ncbi:hypothetical protein [Lysobacter capsici]|uniref:hypothetical protein n=1 Tax=Lysobacter capsici TaxID=435897 RepID=UPI003CCD1C95
MEDEARQAHERLPPARRGRAGATVVGEIAGGAAQQNAARAVQAIEGADDDFVGVELAVEAVTAIQLGLGGVLRDLPADAAFGADPAAVEGVDRVRIAGAGLVAAAEQGDRRPAVARRSARAEADPADLHGGESEAAIVDQPIDRAPRRRA